MARVKNEAILLEKVKKMLPAGVPEWAIESVEIDDSWGWNGYWVYLNDGWTCEMECHTIHEDNLAELKAVVSSIELWKDDPDLTDHRGYTKGQSDYYAKYWMFVTRQAIGE